MGPWGRLILSQLLLGLPMSGSVALPSDNDMTRFRHASFHDEWGTPMLLGGRLVREGAATDTMLHGTNATAQSAWTDHLYPFAWERGFIGTSYVAACRNWWWVSYVASSCYLVGLWAGTSSMRDRKPYDLKALLACWNLFLTVFSFIGMVRTVPHLFLLWREFGVEYTVCRAARTSYGNGPSGLWVLLFIYSKYFELFDTVLLIVRKRKVGFLHWYHHCSVLLYCWHAFVWEMPTGIYFVSMNYSVHAIMYLYYFLAAVRTRPPRWGLFVTVLQLAQMAFGIAITLLHLDILAYETVPHCDGHIPNLTAALGMYASYFILFAQFLFNRYCVKREGAPGVKKVD
uniref:Elongation of fatty acids protein n=1 Tax=Alexandrium catenella TaxID=2925 RepID=A0A7S1LK28_ALECA|mmetsp:Transcript_114071/g.303234  ORF Transcript_114071/g.303234 Transcript_114071/m.303234 type:complete len:343 (+) Transcript_114071:133-1161(+)